MSNKTFNTLLMVVPILLGIGTLAYFSHLDDKYYSLMFSGVLLVVLLYRIFIYHKLKKQ